MFVVGDLLQGVVAWFLLCVPVSAYLIVGGRLGDVRRVLWRLAPVALFYGVYAGLVTWTEKPAVLFQAVANGEGIVSLERTVHLAWEAPLSHLDLPGATMYYDWGQLAMVVAVLLYCALAEGDQFWRVARNSLGVIAGFGFLCYWLVPVAPPWVLPRLYGIHSAGLSQLHGIGELLGAFPSLHTAFAGWAAMVLWSLLPGRWGYIGFVNLVLTAVVVVCTGNHYVVDVLAGELVAYCGCVAASWWDVRRHGLALALPHGVAV